MMKYELPIQSTEHVQFCLTEAAKRYNGKIIFDGGMYLVEDEDAVCHTDAVLREASKYEAITVEAVNDGLEVLAREVYDEMHDLNDRQKKQEARIRELETLMIRLVAKMGDER